MLGAWVCHKRLVPQGFRDMRPQRGVDAGPMMLQSLGPDGKTHLLSVPESDPGDLESGFSQAQAEQIRRAFGLGR